MDAYTRHRGSNKCAFGSWRQSRKGGSDFLAGATVLDQRHFPTFNGLPPTHEIPRNFESHRPRDTAGQTRPSNFICPVISL